MIRNIRHIQHTIYNILRKLRLRTWIALGLILVLLPLVILTLYRPSSTQAEWFDEAYAYRQKFSFTHDADISDKRAITFSLDTAELILASVMQADCDDTRFTDINGKLLEFDLTGTCDNAATAYEVIFESIINGTNVGYVYYGNPSAINAEIDSTVYTALTPSGGDPAITDRASEEKSPGPIAYWKFDEGTDDTCSGGSNDTCDSTSSAADGANSGATWQTENMCVSGKCLLFDGTDDVVTVADTVSGVQSVSFWVKVQDTSTTQEILDLNATDTFSSVSGTLTVAGFGTDTIYVDGVAGATTLTASRWHHVVVTTTTGFSASAIKIGQISTNYGNIFIDKLKLYTYARSAAQVKTDFVVHTSASGSSAVLGAKNQKFLSDGLVGYWDMEARPFLATHADKSGNGASLTGNSTVSAGKFGFSKDLERDNSEFFRVADTTPLSVTGDLTVTAWINPESVTAATQFNIAGKWDGTAESYLLAQYGAGLRFYLNSTLNYVETTSTTLSAGTWYHVMGVYDAATQTAKIFVNGIEQASTTNGTIPSSLTDSTNAFYVGAEDGTWTSVEVAASADDASEEPTPTVIINETANGIDAIDKYLGFRFTGISISQGATVGAFMTVYIDSSTEDEPNHPIWGELVDTGSFTAGDTSDISSRTATTATTTWTSANLEAVGSFNTPTLSAIATEIAAQGSWASGNTMVFIIQGSAVATRDLQTVFFDDATDPAPVLNYSTDSANRYDGKIDEVRVYNRKFTPGEVEDLANWAPGPVGFWNFNEASGTSAFDSSGNGNTGTATQTTRVTGEYGSALEYNASSDFVNAGTDPSISYIESLTFSAWIYPTSGGNRHILSQNQTGKQLRLEGTAGSTLHLQGHLEYNEDGSGIDIVTGNNTISLNTWQHVAMTYDDTGDRKIHLYINGVEAAVSTAATGSPDNNSLFAILFGCSGTGSCNASQFFGGKIDEVYIYNYARTPGQIIEDMNAGHPLGGSPNASQVGYWGFDELYGTAANDKSPNQNTLTLTNPPTWTTSGKIGGALDFELASSQSAVGSDSGALSITGSLSVSAWIKPESTTASTIFPIATKGTDYALVQFGDDIRMYIGSASNYETTNSVGLQPDTWYHVLGVYDAPAQTVTIYINGRQQASTTTGTIPSSIGDSGVFVVGGQETSPATISVAASSDDAYQFLAGQTMTIDGTSHLSDATIEYFGLRFLSVTAPQGAAITSAYITAYFNSATLDEPQHLVWADDIDDAVTYTTTAGDIENRADTTATATWGDCTSLGGAAASYNSPSLASIVQEVVDRGSWAANNSMAFTIQGNTNGACDMQISMWDHATDAEPSFTYSYVDTATYDGVIDEVKVYNDKLTADQVLIDFNAGSSINLGTKYNEADDITDGAGNPPVGYWSFDENTGTTTVNDKSGNGNNGTMGGSMTTADWVPGKYGSGLELDGNNDTIDLGDNLTLLQDLSAATVSVWVKVNSFGSGADLVSFEGTNANNDSRFLVGLRNSDEVSAGGRAPDTQLLQNKLTTGSPISTETWHHILATIDYTNDDVEIFVDGNLQATSGTIAFTNSNTDNTATPDNALGSEDDGSGFHLNGVLDEVKVWNYKLTQAQVAYEYNRGAPVGWWKFDECQGATAYDASGNTGNDGAITSGTGTIGTCGGSAGEMWADGATGKRNSSLDFNSAESEYVDIGDTGFTAIRAVSFWAKPDSTTQELLQLSATDTVQISSGSTSIGGFGTETVYVDGLQTTSFPDTNWHHVTVVSDTNVTANDMDVGRISTNYGDGLIDDVRIYNYALTAAQIKKVMQGGSATGDGVRFGPNTGSP